MKIATDIKPVSYLKSKSADLLKQINETHRPVIITQNGEPKAVIQDPKSYENMRNAIGMLKLISQGEEDIKKGKTRTQEEVFEKLETLLKKRKKSSALYRLPERGRIVPELKEYNILQYREIIIDPWRVIYKVAGKKVFVMAVVDSRRNVEDILLDRLVNHIN
ncbi:MAG: type II toxin-antitoxin system prevent-host-death family antitoxin [Candidatus Scalindua sp.]